MKKTFKILLWCLAVLLVGYTFYYLWKQSQPEEICYELLKPEVRTLVKQTVATGKVEPRDEVNIKPQIQGIVTEIYRETGDHVQAGDPIAKIKVIPEMSTLNNAQSNVRTTQLTLEESEKEHARISVLYQKGVVSKEEYEQSLTNLEKVRESAQAAQDALEIVTDGISKRSGKINTTVVTSTITGTILDIPVKVGTSVVNTNSYNDGTTIATIADMGDIIFRGNIDETEVGRLHTGMPINLTIGALQDIILPATLEYISPKGTESNGAILFEIKAAASIADTLNIRAGYSANAEIILSQRDSVTAVPETAIEFSGDSTFVYRLTSDEGVSPQTFERIAVQIGMSDGLYTEITDGVNPDMQLRGNQK